MEAETTLPPAQQRIWFIEQQCGASAAFNEVVKATIQGPLDTVALERAFLALYQHHPMLRARFRLDGNRVIRYLSQPLTNIERASLAEERARSTAVEEDDALVDRWVSTQAARVIDIATETPLRVSLLSDDDSHSWLVIVFHHIVFDAWSAHVIARDLSEYYRCAHQDISWHLPAEEVRHCLPPADAPSAREPTPHLDYWLAQLRDFERLEMPVDRQIRTSIIHPAATINAAIPRRIIIRVDRMAERHQTTRFVILLSTFYLLLNRYTGQRDLIIGSSVADRDSATALATVAPLINTLVLRATLRDKTTIKVLIDQVKQRVKGALAHKSLPFEELVKHLNLPRERHLHPLFQHAFVLNSTPEPTLSFNGTVTTTDIVESGHALFELFFFLQQTKNALNLSVRYSTALFDAATINNMAQSWMNLLAAFVVAEDSEAIARLPLLMPDQQTQLLVDFNCTDTPQHEATITDVVQRFARKWPEKHALEHNGRTLSYRQLHEESDRIAVYLAEHGIHAGDRVAIALKRSIPFFVCVMGVLKAGAAFIPLDNKQPRERIRAVLAESDCALIITEPESHHDLTDSLATLSYDALCRKAAKSERSYRLRAIHPAQPAYLIYTSGSTGVPKGVVVEHASVVNLAQWQRDYFRLTPESRISQFATVSFDGAIGEMTMALLNGCTLVLLDRDNVEPDALIDSLNQQAISVAVFVPSLLKLLNPDRIIRQSALTIVSVGEHCPPSLAQRWRGCCRFINGYGPTEGTVYSHASDISTPAGQRDHAVNADRKVPIGFPMANVHSYILDDELQLLPQGAIGELYLSGGNLASGYHGHPALTAERFLPNPYAVGMALPQPLILAEASQAIDRFKRKWRDLGAHARAITAQENPTGYDAVQDRATERIFAALITNNSKRAWQRYFLEGRQGTYKAEGLTRALLQTVLELSDFKGMNGADFGFGNGEVLTRLSEMGAIAKGVDYIPSFVDAARQAGQQAELAKIDDPWETFSVDAGITEGSLDFALSTLVLDRVADPKQLLLNIYTSLRQGGRFALQTLLPVIPLDDNPDTDEQIEYTPPSLRLVKGNSLLEDVRDLTLLLEDIFQCDVRMYRFPYVVLSRDGLQEYDVWSFTGGKQVRQAARQAESSHRFSRMYRTGDLARYRSDGNIEILGRIDQQVKLRGYRIELEEIEVALKLHADVADAAVDLRFPAERGGEASLVAWIVPAEAAEVSEQQMSERLRRHLQTILPNFMWPAQYVLQQALPYFPSGKLDRKRMLASSGSETPFQPKPTAQPENSGVSEQMMAVIQNVLGITEMSGHDNIFDLGADSISIIQIVARLQRQGIAVSIDSFFDYQTVNNIVANLSSEEHATQTSVECDPAASAMPEMTIDSVKMALTDVVQEVMAVSPVQLDDNLFDLGLDSIMIIQIVSRIRKKGIDLTIEQCFEHQTVGELATHCAIIQSDVQPVRTTPVSAAFPLTPIQRWYVEQSVDPLAGYNQRFTLHMKTRLPPEKIKQAVIELLTRHPILTLRLQKTDSDGWLQHYDASQVKSAFSLCEMPENQDINAYCAQVEEDANAAVSAQGQTAQFWLVNAADQQRLVIVIHHLAVDVLSLSIVLRDLQDCLASPQPSEHHVEHGFAVWANFLTDNVQQDIFESEFYYWQGLLGTVAAPIPGLVEAKRYHHGVSQRRLLLSSGQTTRLHALAKKSKASLQDCLLTVLALALRRMTGTHRVLMDIETHGRQYVPATMGLERAVGWFSCLFPLVVDIADDCSPQQQIEETSRQYKLRQQHGLAYGLLRYGSQRAAMQVLPKAAVSFNHLGCIDTLLPDDSVFALVEMATDVRVADQQPRPYALDLISFERDKQITLEVIFDNRLDSQLALQLLDHLESIINHFIGGEDPPEPPQDEDVLPLTPVQHGMLLHCLAEPSSSLYLNQLSVDLHGQLDVARFKQAWRRVVLNYSALRVGFHWQESREPLQKVAPDGDVAIITLDWRAESAAQRENLLKKLLLADRQCEFDLSRPPLMRLHIIHWDNDMHKMIWTFHHLLVDGWSVALIFKAVHDSYQGLPLAAPPSFSSQLSWALQQSAQDHSAFWQRALQDVSVMPLLPIDRGPQQLDETAVGLPGECSHVFSSEQRAALDGFCRENRLTVNSVITAVWGLLLTRYTGESQALFGVTLSGRTIDMPQMEHCVGMFINTVIFRVHADPDLQVKTWLFSVQKQQIALQSVQSSPLSDVIRWVDLPRGEQPYQSVVLFENYPLDHRLSQNSGELRFDNARTIQQSNYPLMLVVIPTDPFVVQLNYDTRRFTERDIRLLLDRFLVMLTNVIDNGEQPLSTVSEWTPEDWQNHHRFSRRPMPVKPAAGCLQDIFVRQVEATPNRVAVRAGVAQITYLALNRKANQFACYLQQKGAGPETVVGLCVEPGIDMYVGLLAILKAGGAYLPLDPTLPQMRLASIVASAGIRLVLTQTLLQQAVASIEGIETVLLDNPDAAVTACSHLTPEHGCHDDNLAYVMFTSGSTGEPKGVMGTHRSTKNCLEWMWRDSPFATDEVCCQKTAYTFGDSIQEIFGPLLQGVMTVVIDNHTLLSMADLIAVLQQHRVTRIVLVPSLLRQLLDSGENLAQRLAALNYWLASGEALPDGLSAAFYRQLPNARLFNMYGTSELSNDVTLYAIPPTVSGNGYSPIGRPVADMTVYLLDRRMRQVPMGIVGEIYVGGPGVNRGYQGKAGLTASAFLPDPFTPMAGALMYKTGDLGFINDAAQLVFSGRADQQVNLRGFRIELDEIIHAAETHPGIKQCFVTTIANPRQEAQIVAALELTRVQQLLHDQRAYELPNHLIVLHHSKAETDHTWREIFDDRDYVRHGIVVSPGDVVVDVGANIGLFSLFVHYEFGARVYAIEPAPASAALLRQNYVLHRCQGKVFEVGCGARHERRRFTTYEGSSLTSGFFADPNADGYIVKAAATKHLLDAPEQQQAAVLAERIEDLIDSRMVPQHHMLEVRPLSALLADMNEPVIHLLKIDVERAELQVLEGIDEQDWSRLRQIVLEVEDRDRQLDNVTSLLTAKGYALVVEASGHFPGVPLYMVYARRSYEESATPAPGLEQAAMRYARAPVKMDLDADSIRAYLAERLPNYMVPASIEVVSKMEKTSSGKISRTLMRQRLQDAASHRMLHATPPQGAMETLIAQVWSEFLHVPSVGREDNFFDLGGHSLLVIAVCNEITRRSGNALSFIDLFRHPSVSQLAKHLSGIKQTSFNSAVERGQRRQSGRRAKYKGELL
ncbi:non-ribosomal peptide synthetase [Musicola paradisiaca]|uniref:non-ribosomal peptide synthetase n=1 Tax=Musicola paradisiaca TaxID=69223 RepID=UPI001885906D|nr:non-ribosomal peptide synthetase [Musicola paradisiaca]